MASDDQYEGTYTNFHGGTIEGTLGKDPKRISGDGRTACVILRVAVKSKGRNGEATGWMDVKTFGRLAENCEKSFSSGDRVVAFGSIEFEDYQDKTNLIMNARAVGASLFFNTVEINSDGGGNGGGSSRSSSRRSDDDEDDRRSSRRRSDDDEDRGSRRRRDDDDEEDTGRRSRRRSDDNDDEEDDRPRRRSRRRDDDD